MQDTSNPNATTLYPGQGSFDITGTITNGGSGNQGLSTLVVQVNAPTGGGGYSNEAACSAADFVLSATSASGWAITNGGDTATYTFSPVNDVQPAGVVGYPPGLSLAMVDNTTAAQDNCQGATANWSDTAS